MAEVALNAPNAGDAVDGLVRDLVDLVADLVEAVGWIAVLNVLRTVACRRREPYIDGVLQGTAAFIKSRNVDGIPSEV